MTLRYPEVRVMVILARTTHRCGRVFSPSLTHFLFQNPTQDEREALEAYMYLTSRLYPCGECAAEFQDLLKKFPPQVRAGARGDDPQVLPFSRRRHRVCPRVYGMLLSHCLSCHGMALIGFV